MSADPHELASWVNQFNAQRNLIHQWDKPKGVSLMRALSWLRIFPSNGASPLGRNSVGKVVADKLFGKCFTAVQ